MQACTSNQLAVNMQTTVKAVQTKERMATSLQLAVLVEKLLVVQQALLFVGLLIV